MADFYPGLSDSEAADLASSQGSTAPSSSGPSLLSSLATLAGAGVGAYNAANKPKQPTSSNSTVLLIGGALALALVLILVLALKK